MKTLGTVHKKGFLAFNEHIGVASFNGKEFDLGVVMPVHQPMITHPDGRVWVLDWDAITRLAQKAFDDDEAKVGEAVGDGQ